MTTGSRPVSIPASLMCLTHSWTGAAAGFALCAGLAGCVPAQTEVGGSSGILAPASPESQLAQSHIDGAVRIEAIQRYEGERAEPVTGVVTVRNTGSAPRTVRVGVTWLSKDGRAIDPNRTALETVTLAPRESREIVFRGEQGSRDFKVALTSAVQ